MRDNRPTSNADYGTRPAGKESKLWKRDQPTRNSSYVTRPADKEAKLWDTTGRQGKQATGRRRLSRGTEELLPAPAG
ncbi:hypothetical protein OH76DRAFT_161403 [Lentinus brumalis]|uniref:Uncharacterized protein n=1 Tax=Lentinus brumalis TaxID=2498619 RepID=A0A371DIX1_9APHY|nr:hypothetical protein OH76DRAFT_161403 [Polyporus brumalis]